MPDTQISVGVSFPGEMLIVELLRTITAFRESQSQTTRDGWDQLALGVAQMAFERLKSIR